MNTLQTILTGLMMMSITTALSNDNNLNKDLSIEILEIKNPTCNASTNGFISVEPIGGEAPYTYDWNTYPNQTTPTAENLSSGIYFIEVTDAKGNTFFQSIELIAPNTINGDENSASLNSEEPIVNMEFSMEGGNAPYTYEFNGNPLNEPRVDNLTVGIHTLIITDANNCSMIQYIQVFEVEGENIPKDESLLSWTIFNQEPKEEKAIVHVEFSEMIPVENLQEEEILMANE